MAADAEAQLDAKIAELKELVREANGTLNDIRKERRAVEKTIREFRDGLEEHLNVIIEQAVATGLTELSESIEKAIGNATEAVYRRFDVIADALTGNDPESRAAGKPPLDVLARRVAAQKAAGL
jgi:chromosome segregation ATPase